MTSSTRRRWPLPSGKWAPLPIAVGLGCLGYLQWGRVRERRDREMGVVRPVPRWKVAVYTSLPLRWTSHQFGRLMNVELPASLRPFVIGGYARAFGCDLDEAVRSDVRDYKSLGEFFRRPVKKELRPISRSILVCPSDGRVHRAGRATDGRLEQVKGVDYTLHEFLGQDVKLPPTDRLHYCVIYLAPGDYHGLHSPADWTISHRRHTAGLMLSVRIALLDRLAKLLCINERVALHGSWNGGYMCMTAVAATNVGNIVIDNDTVHTNRSDFIPPMVDDRVYSKTWQAARGDRIGEFRLGSSVVLIFEAPNDFQFSVRPGDKVRYGQSLGFLRDQQ